MDLHSEFTGRGHHDGSCYRTGFCLLGLRTDGTYAWDAECKGFAGAGLSDAYDVAAGEEERPGSGLNWGGGFEGGEGGEGGRRCGG